MPLLAQNFIKGLIDGTPLNLPLHTVNKFGNDLQLHALRRIKYLILNILGSHLPHEYIGSEEPFYLSDEINAVDQLGLNILDYCALSGLDDLGCIFAKLGAKNTIDLHKVKNHLSRSFDSESTPMFITDIIKSITNIENSKQKYKDNPLDHKSSRNSGKPRMWQRLKSSFKNFHYSNHKFALFILAFGISCLIAAPFTGGISTILLLSLGFPSMLAGLGNLQNAFLATKDYQKNEDAGRILHETEMLKTIHEDVLDQIREITTKAKIKQDIKLHVKSCGAKLNEKAPDMLHMQENHKHRHKPVPNTGIRHKPVANI